MVSLSLQMAVSWWQIEKTIALQSLTRKGSLYAQLLWSIPLSSPLTVGETCWLHLTRTNVFITSNLLLSNYYYYYNYQISFYYVQPFV